MGDSDSERHGADSDQPFLHQKSLGKPGGRIVIRIHLCAGKGMSKPKMDTSTAKIQHG